MIAPSLFVPSRVHRQLRQLARNADTADKQEEVGGVLQVVGDDVVEFEQWENTSLVPVAWFEWDETRHRLPALPSFIVHSHPGSDGTACASVGDGEWMRASRLRLGVYSPQSDRLRLFVARVDGGIVELPVYVDYARSVRPRPARPGSR